MSFSIFEAKNFARTLASVAFRLLSSIFFRFWFIVLLVFIFLCQNYLGVSYFLGITFSAVLLWPFCIFLMFMHLDIWRTFSSHKIGFDFWDSRFGTPLHIFSHSKASHVSINVGIE